MVSARKEPRAGQLPSYVLKVHPRAKRVTLRVRAGEGLIVTVPPYSSVESVERILVDRLPWIERTLASVEERARASMAERAALDLPREIDLPSCGLHLDVSYEKTPAQSVSVQRVGPQQLHVFGAIDQRALACSLLTKATSKVAEPHISARVGDLALRSGLVPPKVLVRSQKTRWGSCSYSGIIRLNVRLAFLEQRLSDYVILHELTHLEHHNHSREFYHSLSLKIPASDLLRKEMRSAALLVPSWVV
jgi:predicted metal-dependent hydrolase